jgi:hypothetical protein
LALRWLVVASFFSADSAHRLSEFLSHPALPALWRLVLWSAIIAFASALIDFLVRTYALNQTVALARIPYVTVSAALSLLGGLTAYGAWLRRDLNNPLDRFSPLRAGALLLGLIATYGLSWLVPETASMVPVALLMLMASFAVSPRVAYALCAVAVIALSYCLALALQHPALLEVAQHNGLPYVQSVIFSVLLGGLFLAAQSAERQRLIANLQRRDSDLRLTTNMLAHDLKSRPAEAQALARCPGFGRRAGATEPRRAATDTRDDAAGELFGAGRRKASRCGDLAATAFGALRR